MQKKILTILLQDQMYNETSEYYSTTFIFNLFPQL